MPIQFTCPHCNDSVSVDEKYAGATGPCRSCQKEITIPGVATTAPAVESTGVATPPAAKSSFPWVPVLAGCGVLSLLFIGLLVALLLPAVSAARQAAVRVQCQAQQKQIVMSMLNHESARQRVPPAYSVDAEGKPMHSWRVLILPYLGENALYDRFNMQEPWDSPHNLEVAKTMPDIYRCPSHESAGETNTSYMVICDPNSAFPPATPKAGKPSARGLRFGDMKDGTSNIVAIVEVSGPGVHWTEPTDLSLAELSQINSTHGVANVTYLDAHSEPVQQVTPSMVIRNDGQ